MNLFDEVKKLRVLKTLNQEICLKTANIEVIILDHIYDKFDACIALFRPAKSDNFRRMARETIFESIILDIEQTIQEICGQFNMVTINAAVPQFNMVIKHVFYAELARKIRAAGL